MNVPSPRLAAAAPAAGAALGFAVHVVGERTGSGWALLEDVAAGVVLALVLLAGAAVLRRDRGQPDAPAAGRTPG